MSSGAAGIASHVNRKKRHSTNLRGDLRGSQRDLRGSLRDANHSGARNSVRSLAATGRASAANNRNDAAMSWSADGRNREEQQHRQEQHRKEGAALSQDRILATIPDHDGDDEGRGGEAGHRRLLRNLNKARKLCGRFINDSRVQFFVVILIAINAIMMGVGTFDFVTDDPAIEEKFEAVDQVFLIIFTVELVMQFIYHGLRMFLDGWLIFDFIVIVMSWAFAQAQIIRAFRIFRALRLITRVAVMRNLVIALFAVMPRMAAIGLLLLLIMYIFSVMFTQLFKYMFRDGLTEFDYFSDLGGTFFTLFQIMTLDAWADVARDVMATYPWAWLPFIVFVIISGFIVVNLIIAVICDAISTLHDDEKAALQGGVVDGEEGSGACGGKYDNEDLDLSPEEVQQREIETLENQIEELTKVQEQTMKNLEFLTQQLQKSALARAQLGGSRT